MEKILYSERKAAEALGCMVQMLHNIIARRRLPSRRPWRGRMIPYARELLSERASWSLRKRTSGAVEGLMLLKARRWIRERASLRCPVRFHSANVNLCPHMR
jgi:Ser/Thr protein kinase RdoA (MazF antagonist)